MKKVLFALMVAFAATACYDDSALRGELDDLSAKAEELAGKVTALEEKVATLQLDVDAMTTLANAIKNGKYITSVETFTAEDGKTGYTIKFNEGEPIVVYNGVDGVDGVDGTNGTNGTDGTNGVDGVTPTVEVKDVDGVLYWFINGEKVCTVYEGTPVFSSKDGKLYVQYPGSEELVEIGELVGKSLFDDVKVTEEYVEFVLLSGDTFKVPVAAPFSLEINTTVGLKMGQTEVEIPYEVKGATEATVVDVIAYGCKAVVEAKAIKVSAITEGAQLLVFADNGDGKTSIKKIVFDAEKYSVEAVDEVVAAEGGNVTVKGFSNVAFDVEIPAAATWLTQTETKTAFELTFAVAANTAYEPREAVVAFVRQNTTDTLMTVKIAQAAAEEPKDLDLKRVWGKYSTTEPWYNFGVDPSAATNLDRGWAMDTENIYVSKSTAYAPVITAFPLDGSESFNINVTGMGPENQWGDAMQYTVNALNSIKKADGTYVLIASNLKLDASHVLEVWAWVDGVNAAPKCIGRYAYDSVANASDHRRYGDRFSVSGTWEEGKIWFPSMQADDHGKTVVFNTTATVDASNRPVHYYRMEPSQSNMKDYAFYPDSDEVFSTSNGVAAFVKLDGTTHAATGWVNWAVTDDYSTTHVRTFGYNFFEMNGKKYVAFVKIPVQNGKTGSLVVIEDGDGTLAGFKSALTANKVAWEFPLQHESDLTAEACQATGNTLGGCKVIEIDGVTYIGAHVQGLGCSLFRFE